MAGVDVLNQVMTTGIFILKWFWWFFLLVWLFFMKWRLKNWPVEAVIIEKRGNNLIKTNDRAGKYTDPFTGITGYKLQKCKDTIPVINYDWVLHNVTVHNTLLERIVGFLRGNIGTVFFFRYGSRQYKPIKITINNNSKMELQEVKDEKGNPLFIQVYRQFDPRSRLGLLDFEVVDWDNMNFMVQEQRASAERRQKTGEWVKTIAIPLAIIGAAVIFSIIMIKFGYDFASSIRSQDSSTPQNNEPAKTPNIPGLNGILPGN